MIDFVQSKSVDGGTATSTPLTFNSNVRQGSLIVVDCRVSANGRTITVTDNNNNVYASAYTALNDANGDDMITFYAQAAAPGSTTVTVAISGVAAGIRLAITEYTGLPFTGAFSVATRQAYSASSTPSSGNITLGQVPALLHCFVDNGGAVATSFTVGASFTKLEQLVVTNLKIGTQYRIVNAPGTYSAGVTLSGADGGGVAIIAFVALAQMTNNYQFAHAGNGISVTEGIR